MNQHIVQPIGSVLFTGAKAEIRIDAPFRKALRGLEAFSHVLALVDANGRLALKVLGISSLDAKNGLLVCSGAMGVSRPRDCPLFDLKPYLPCEDRVVDSVAMRRDFPPITLEPSKDGGRVLSDSGVVRTAGGNPYLQFSDEVPVEEGDVVRVVWWFSRFEDAKYRRVTTCRPPYETEREIGVFASRSPVRPNPIALTTVKVLRVDRERSRASVNAIECFDATPFVGVLPYDASRESLADVHVGAWAKGWPDRVNFASRTDDAAEIDRLAEEIDAQRRPIPADDEVGEAVDAVAVEPPTAITVRGARTHNLKGVDVTVPYGKITAIVGVSGSGKSSLAADTIAAECQRRMDCLGDRDDEAEPVAVEEMGGCLPVIRIAQRRLRPNVRSTVATFSGAATHLRALYAKLGTRHYANGESVAFKVTPATFSAYDPDARCPVCDGCGVCRKADPKRIVAHPESSLLEGASPLLGRLDSFLRRPNANWLKGQVVALAQKMNVDLAKPWNELPEEYRSLLLAGDPSLTVTFSYAGGANGRGCETSRPLEGLLPAVERLCADGGASSTANRFLSESPCPVCHGERLAGEGRLVTLCGVRYPVCERMTFDELRRFLDVVEREHAVGEASTVRCRDHIASLRSLCRAARRLGISEIELNRLTSALSGGEAQRLKLLTAFHNHLSGLLYVFDEPSQNLGRAEYGCVAGLMRELTDEGNTVLMVEHNPEMIAIADHVIEIGPGAGVSGGTVVGEGTYADLCADPHTLLGAYAKDPPVPARTTPMSGKDVFSVRNVCCHTLVNVSVDFLKGAFTCITGVSGSGKSSLLYGGVLPQAEASDAFEEVIVVESRIACSTPRSTVATYTGIVDELRRVKADIGGWLRFSVDEAGERAETEGLRFAKLCRLMSRNGLGYLLLGQQTSTLSGGEAARLKIACSLGAKKRKNALYLLDEPTCGLHFSDIDRLLSLVLELVEAGNTVIAIEHNARFLSAADRIVTMGPGSGHRGGRIVRT